MKMSLILLSILLSLGMAGAQNVFQENFESFNVGADLANEGYVLSKGSNYDGIVTAVAAESGGNKFARLKADVNASANMQIAKTIDVEPGKVYTFEMESLGPFKRQLRVYNQIGEQIASSKDYKPDTDPEKTAWYKMEASFFVPEGNTKITIGFHHYWSGTIDLDNIRVYEEEVNRRTSYYVSSSLGNDDNEGSETAPFKSLEKISSTILFPGDSVLFMRGDTLRGHFVVNGSGSEDKPLLITSYGNGAKPILTGQVGEVGGGDYQEAIYVLNQDNMVFEEIEIQNDRHASRAGVDDTDGYGIYVRNNGNKVMRNFTFRNVTFKYVFAADPMLDREDFDKIQVSALNFDCSKNTEAGKEKNIQEILVEDCYFAYNQRLGIKFGHSKGDEGIGNDSINRIMNIIIRNNEFYYNGGTGVLPNSTYNCLIENNIFDHPGASTDPRMPGRGSSVWNYQAINTIVQYNMCLSTRGYLDSYGIHIDKHNKNTFVQYNYMDDCIGGFVEILANNINAVYRFNVSVNSGFRYTNGVSDWKAGSSTIYIYSDRWTEPNQSGLMLSDGVYVYNNTVVMDSTFETTFSVDAKNMHIFNNIFSSTNGAKMGYLQTSVRDNDTPFILRNNLYEGDVNPEWVNYDTNPVKRAANFNLSGENEWAYQLKAGSGAINSGVALTGPAVENAGYGVFKDIPVYPTVDFYGNPIDLSTGTPNIGACNAKNGEIKTGFNAIHIEQKDSPWLVYPRLNESLINLVNSGEATGKHQISLINLKGQIVQMLVKNIIPGEREFDVPLDRSIPNGIYVLNISGKGKSQSRRMILHR